MNPLFAEIYTRIPELVNSIHLPTGEDKDVIQQIIGKICITGVLGLILGGSAYLAGWQVDIDRKKRKN
jgi:hypothetical protein